ALGCFDLRAGVRCRARILCPPAALSLDTRPYLRVIGQTGTHRQSSTPMRPKGRMKLMGKTMEYQGYTIQSTPYYETEWKKWRLRIVVSAEDFPDVQPREFSFEILYAT